MRSRLLVPIVVLSLASCVIIAAEKATGNEVKKKPAASKLVKKATTIAGVPWHNSLDDAFAESKKTGKPVLVLQMFGNLDDDFC